MMTFCFNHCLGGCKCCIEPYLAFGELLKAHVKLGLATDYPVLLPCEPAKIMIGGVSLKKLVESLPEGDLRHLAYSFLSKYPLTTFFTSEPEVADDEWGNYCWMEKDAEDLFWAYKLGWTAVSVPVCDEVKKDWLILCSDKLEVPVNNWYGGNLQFIRSLETEESSASEKRLVELECLFEGKTVRLSEPFKKVFRKSPAGLQKLVLAKFRDAYGASLLFPSRGDDCLVKYCEGKGNENTYELRSRAMGGMRVYFCSDEGSMIVASLHTKSKSVGVEQTSDINNASAIIKKMRR